MRYSGFVAIPQDVIDKWRTQLRRSWAEIKRKYPDQVFQTMDGLKKGKDCDDIPFEENPGGSSGMYYFAKKYIREQLKIPKSEVLDYCVRQKRIVRKIGNVWFFIVETRPRKR